MTTTTPDDAARDEPLAVPQVDAARRLSVKEIPVNLFWQPTASYRDLPVSFRQAGAVEKNGFSMHGMSDRPTAARQTDAARMISVCPQTIRNWERQGPIAGARGPGNSRLYAVGGLKRLAGIETDEPARIAEHAASRQVTYFFQAGADGPVKIGRAADAQKRLCALQAGCPSRLTCLGTLDGDRETEMHQRFKALHLRGEWFRPEPALLDYIRDNCAGATA